MNVYPSASKLISHLGCDTSTQVCDTSPVDLENSYWINMAKKPCRSAIKPLLLMIWEVWKGHSVWWWDGCVWCPWKTENAVRIYAAFLVLIVLRMWWGVEDWDRLGIWSVRVWMIGCLLAESWWWRGREVGAGVGRHGNSVLGMTWNCSVCILSGLF